MADLTGLSIRGRVATADESGWDEARQAWNLAADQRPSAVAFVESADDVAKVVGFARENGLEVAAQGTGHGAMALGSLDDVILIKTERMRSVDLLLPPGHLAERRRHRLHARRRAQLVRSQVRVGVQQGDRDRAGHRGW